MVNGSNFARTSSVLYTQSLKAWRTGLLAGVTAFAVSVIAALVLPKGFALAAVGDTLQVVLVVVTAVLAFQNFLQSRSRARIFWFLIFTGSLLWAISNGIWAVYELGFARPVPDLAVIDILLFIKVVPLTAAIAIAPDKIEERHFRAFGLLDVFVLIVFSLYLYAFCVFAYRLLPGAEAMYAHYFNLADAIGNETLVVMTGIAALRARGDWRWVYRVYFFSAACYGLGSNLSNVAIDVGRYYTGSLYDLPLMASLAGFLCMALCGRTPELRKQMEPKAGASEARSSSATFVSEHLAMLVVLSAPAIGIWLLSNAPGPPQLRSFRLGITLLTIFALMLLLSVKEDILTAGLFQSLQNLSETHTRIERYKSHLTQTEKLATLGKLVAQGANQIKDCMLSILDASSRLTSHPDADSRIQNLAGKIGQYAQRTDALVDNMLHFAQETSLRFAPCDLTSVIDSALHLSRVAKIPQLRVQVTAEDDCPQVRADSSELLHVFLQLISNAVDALAETNGGTLDITLHTAEDKVIVEFADSGPGLKEPQRVFEPFYTTKPVGKGTGLGLSTCYGIIQQHQGEISCRNRPEGGAVFTISLPVAAKPAAEMDSTSEPLLEGVR
jgi:signal transduction histidine kinase/cbb3-type cytochrome oxidase subunit 3